MFMSVIAGCRESVTLYMGNVDVSSQSRILITVCSELTQPIHYTILNVIYPFFYEKHLFAKGQQLLH